MWSELVLLGLYIRLTSHLSVILTVPFLIDGDKYNLFIVINSLGQMPRNRRDCCHKKGSSRQALQEQGAANDAYA
jgi:hypothetical protein